MRDKALALAVCGLCLGCWTNALGDEVGGFRHSLSAGLTVADFDYRESDAGDRLNHEQGVLPGLDLKWQVLGNRYLAEAEFAYLEGDVDYDGTTQAGSPVHSATDEDLWRGAITAGWRIRHSSSIEYQAITGIGYREWQRDIQATQNASGLRESYTFWYGNIGLRVLYQPRTQQRWALELSANRPLNPQVRVAFENEFDAARLDLGENTTLNAALSWRYDLDASLGLEAELFYRAWDLGRSADQLLTQNGVTVGTLFEPGSESALAGFAVRLVKRF